MLNLTKSERQKLPGEIYTSLRDLCQGKPLAGLAREVDRNLRAENPDFGTAGNSILIPLAELSRALTTNVFTAAGALVESDQGDIDPALRAASVVGRAGATFLTGLHGTHAIPRQVTAQTVGWYHESDSVTESDGTFGQLTLTPHRCAGATSISTQLDAQSGEILTRFLLESLAAGIGAALDLAALNGSGVAGEPAGIYQTSGISTITFSAAATLAKVLSMEKTLTTSNVADENISFVGHPATREKWRALDSFSGAGKPLWNLEENKVLNHPAYVTTNMPTTGIMAGDFTKMIVGIWGEGAPIQLIVDKFSLSLAGKIRFVAQILADVGTCRPTAFIVNADSAIQ